jgi:rod shape-determining protein MreD
VKSDGLFWLFIVLVVVVHFFLQLTLGLGTRAPDLLTVAVLLGARPLSGGAAAGLGFVLGLLEDAVSIAAFGVAAATFTIIAYLGARTRDFFVGESVLFLAVYLFLGKWVQTAIYYGLAGGVRRGEPVEMLLMEAPLHSLYAAAAGLVALTIYRTLRR